tara:strand:- start:358 stop:531 length:174 start_codon:yes stop_codon:yes gene_type:complete
MKNKNIDINLRKSFLYYISDGNVFEIEKNVFTNQISMYKDRTKGIKNLYKYFIKNCI